MKVRFQKIISMFLAVVLSLFAFVTPAFANPIVTVLGEIAPEVLSMVVGELISAGGAWLQSKITEDSSDEEVNNFPALYWTASPDPGLIGAEISLVGVSYEQLVDIQTQLASVGIPVDVMPYETLGGYVLQCNSNVFTNPDTGERYTLDDNVLFGKYVMFSTGQVPVGFTDGTVLTEISSTFSGTISVVANSDSYPKNFSFTSHHDGTTQYIRLGTITSGSIAAFLPDPITINTPDVVYDEGVIAVYYDSYFRLLGFDSGDNMNADYPQTYQNYNLLMYTDSSGATKTTVMDDMRHYAPELSGTTAVLLRGSIEIPYGQTISNIQITYQDSNNVDPQIIYHDTYDSHEISVDYCVPSCIVLNIESSEVLGRLEGIADQLVSIDETLMSMYGDIVSLLNDIYLKLGDIEAVETISKNYLGTILTKVNSIDTTISQMKSVQSLMYTLMQTYLPYLEDLVTSSDDINTTLETELSSIDSKLNTFLILYNGFLDDFDNLLEYESANNQVLNNVYSALNSCLQYLMHIWWDTQDIVDDFESYNATLQQVLEYTMYDYAVNLAIADKLDTLISIMDDFTDGYIAGASEYVFPDGYEITYADGTASEKFSFFDLAKAVVNGIWHIITGVVTTFIGGLSGLISGISNVTGFFDFYRDGEIYGLTEYQGGDIWD